MNNFRNSFILLLSLFIAFHAIAITPQNTRAARQADTTDDGRLSILSWNIYMLPKFVVRPGKRDRAHAIVEQLKTSNFDVIVFQEAFLPAARKIIQKGLSDIFPYHYGPANNSPSILTNSGVWVISRKPMKVVDEIRFEKCKGYDCYARKGAILLEGDNNGKPYQVLGTHLQADNEQDIRFKQMDQIYFDLLLKYKRDDVPQIVCGDLNTEQEMEDHYCEMLSCLDAEDGELGSIEKCTYDGVNNDIAQSYGAKTKFTLDYILLRSNGAKVNGVKRFVSIFKKGRKHLSDHYGVVCELKF